MTKKNGNPYSTNFQNMDITTKMKISVLSRTPLLGGLSAGSKTHREQKKIRGYEEHEKKYHSAMREVSDVIQTMEY